MNIDLQTCLLLTAKISAVGVAIADAEYLANRRLLTNSGLMSWILGRLRAPVFAVGTLATCLDSVLRYPNVLVLIGMRMALAVCVVAGDEAVALNGLILLAIAILSMSLVVRTTYGHDGSDQMTSVIFWPLGICMLVGTDLVTTAGVWFIAMQACLSYLTAGVAKASARGWRDGSYLVGIAGTQIYGNASIAAHLKAHPRLAKLISRFIIGWECFFPLVIVTPYPLSIAILISGVLFHALNAVLMGLNCFLWTFVATYPAILYCVQSRGW